MAKRGTCDRKGTGRAARSFWEKPDNQEVGINVSDATNEAGGLLDGIPMLRNRYRLERIHRGYSSDHKYMVNDHEGNPQYVLRTYSIQKEKDKENEFKMLQRMEEIGVRCTKPIESGVLPSLGLGYMIVSYIEGEEASEALPFLAEKEQYDIGIQAGLELRKMHQIPCTDDDVGAWHERMTAKYDRNRAEYAKCGIAIEEESRLLSFIDGNLHLMKNRPNLFQHDDYHVGNLIVKDGAFSGVIDFNRYDWGDPIHEFVKAGMFSAEASVPFCVGQIQGYHDCNEPGDEFWRLYSLYLAMTLISSVVWILRVRPEELDSMMGKIRKVLDDHDHFERIVPKWYRK